MQHQFSSKSDAPSASASGGTQHVNSFLQQGARQARNQARSGQSRAACNRGGMEPAACRPVTVKQIMILVVAPAATGAAASSAAPSTEALRGVSIVGRLAGTPTVTCDDPTAEALEQHIPGLFRTVHRLEAAADAAMASVDFGVHDTTGMIDVTWHVPQFLPGESSSFAELERWAALLQPTAIHECYVRVTGRIRVNSTSPAGGKMTPVLHGSAHCDLGYEHMLYHTLDAILTHKRTVHQSGAAAAPGNDVVSAVRTAADRQMPMPSSTQGNSLAGGGANARRSHQPHTAAMQRHHQPRHQLRDALSGGPDAPSNRHNTTVPPPPAPSVGTLKPHHDLAAAFGATAASSNAISSSTAMKGNPAQSILRYLHQVNRGQAGGAAMGSTASIKNIATATGLSSAVVTSTLQELSETDQVYQDHSDSQSYGAVA